jgi:hypothetical protein
MLRSMNMIFNSYIVVKQENASVPATRGQHGYGHVVWIWSCWLKKQIASWLHVKRIDLVSPEFTCGMVLFQCLKAVAL